MKRLQKAALITDLVDRLRERGSWAGETHLQKCLFFLQEMRHVPTGYEFQLYKYGPFSFDLREELIELRGDQLLIRSPRGIPYGPSFSSSEASKTLRERLPKTLATYDDDLQFVADHFGDKDVNQLEKLSTAFFFMKSQPDSDQNIAKKVHEVKPHVSVPEAEEASKQVRALAET